MQHWILKKRVYLRYFLPLFFIALLGWGRITDPGGVFEKLQLSVIDLYSITGTSVPANKPSRIVPAVSLIEIDEKTLDAYGQWPWSREKIANILISIYEKGALAVGLDVLLVEPDRLSPSNYLVPYLERGVNVNLFKNDYGYIDNDAFLSDVLEQTPSVLAVAGAHNKSSLPESGFNFAFVNTTIDKIPETNGLLLPTEALLKANPALGHIVVFTDIDGMLRKIPSVIRVSDKVYPSFFISLIAKIQGVSTLILKGDPDGSNSLEMIKVGNVEIPIDDNGQLRLLSSEVLKKESTISLVDVIDGKHDSLIENAVVVIGPTALGLMDFHDVPGGLSVPGPLIHVAALNQAFANKHLVRNEVIIGLEWTTGIALAFLFLFLVSVLPGIWSSLLFVMTTIGYVGTGFWVYQNYGIALDWSFGVLFALVSFLTTLAVVLLRTEGERGQIRKAFSTYLSPDLVAELSKNPDKLRLGGERKRLTVLFADIRGFTAMSERYIDHPEALTELLNDLLTPLTDQIIDRQGTIDKYMGDAIMAFWNAPLDVDRPANKACEAALGMLDALDALNNELISAGRIVDPLRIGIGINTGNVTVGNLGSHQRFDYSCLGDPVNLASRLEGLSKAYGVPIVMGQAVVKCLEGDIKGGEVVLLDEVKVVGKQIPEKIYGLIPKLDGTEPAWCALHKEIIAEIKQQNWIKAKKIMLLLKHQNDYPSQLNEQLEIRLQSRSSVARQMDKK